MRGGKEKGVNSLLFLQGGPEAQSALLQLRGRERGKKRCSVIETLRKMEKKKGREGSPFIFDNKKKKKENIKKRNSDSS